MQKLTSTTADHFAGSDDGSFVIPTTVSTWSANLNSNSSQLTPNEPHGIF